MKRFFSRLFRFFWSWGFLKFVLFAITLVVLLYVEEDWRGARAWAATKAKWEARGVSFDFNTYLPPPVPDGQNLATLPLFKLEPDPDPDPQRHGFPATLALHRAFAHDIEGHYLTLQLDRQNGHLSDIDKLKQTLTAQYAAAFPGKTPPSDLAQQYAELYHVMEDLRQASMERPHCRFELSYDFDSRSSGDLPLVTAGILLARMLRFDAIAALASGKSDQALADVRLNNRLAKATMDESILVSGLVAIGMIAIDLSAVYQGLAEHQWSDRQLAEIEESLGQLDFLAGYQRAMRGEAIGVSLPALEKYKAHGSISLPDAKKEKLVESTTPVYWADGWTDIWKSQLVDHDLSASTWVDLQKRAISTSAMNDYVTETDRQIDSWTSYLPWNFLLRIAGTEQFTKELSSFSQMQVWVDEARIACALERYRLAHGAYAATLDALAPQLIDAVPHDVMNGEPYHYRLNADGTFLLYSVGWNQRDDGGVEVKESNGISRDYTKGDWVWPMPRR